MPSPNGQDVAARWYAESSPMSPLAQGDQLWDLDILDAHVGDAGTVSVDRLRVSLIILTQSCDLEYEKVASVLTSPIYDLGAWLQVNPMDLFRLEDVRRGYDPSLYLLPAWPEAQARRARVDRLVDLSSLRVVRLEMLRSALGSGADRASLSSPAREHFSQAVARMFMRVGLPADIPPYDLKRQAENELQLIELPTNGPLLRLTRPLRVASRRYVRSGSGETYWGMTSKGANPALLGAGCSEEDAAASLGTHAALALDKLRAGDTAWSWLRKYLSESI